MNEHCCRQRGFTIVELMVTLAIAAVLIGLAAPAFNEFLAQRRLTSQVNDFLVGLQYARSEAVRRGARVSLQSMDASDAANEWGKGYCVVVGNPGNCDDRLRTFAAIGDNTLNANDALDTLGTLTFDARGLLLGGGAGSVDLCDPTADRGRRIDISLIGRVSSQELDCNP
jgi:type IV fimbrial biogenesis protein FimT